VGEDVLFDLNPYLRSRSVSEDKKTCRTSGSGSGNLKCYAEERS
jgi:hypothetical protein